MCHIGAWDLASPPCNLLHKAGMASMFVCVHTMSMKNVGAIHARTAVDTVMRAVGTIKPIFSAPCELFLAEIINVALVLTIFKRLPLHVKSSIHAMAIVRMSNKLIVALALLALPHAVWANDSAFGGAGALPMPIKQTDVRMVKENILIKGDNLSAPNSSGAWRVRCQFQFRNEADAARLIQMGFPLPVRDAQGVFSFPQGYSAKVGEPLVYRFKVQVNGRPLTFQEQKNHAQPTAGVVLSKGLSLANDI